MLVTVPGKEGKDIAPGPLNVILQKSWPEMTTHRYPVVIEKTQTGFSAYSPDMPGCIAVGDTEQETLHNFQDALQAHFDAMHEIGE